MEQIEDKMHSCLLQWDQIVDITTEQFEIVQSFSIGIPLLDICNIIEY